MFLQVIPNYWVLNGRSYLTANLIIVISKSQFLFIKMSHKYVRLLLLLIIVSCPDPDIITFKPYANISFIFIRIFGIFYKQIIHN